MLLLSTITLRFKDSAKVCEILLRLNPLSIKMDTFSWCRRFTVSEGLNFKTGIKCTIDIVSTLFWRAILQYVSFMLTLVARCFLFQLSLSSFFDENVRLYGRDWFSSALVKFSRYHGWALRHFCLERPLSLSSKVRTLNTRRYLYRFVESYRTLFIDFRRCLTSQSVLEIETLVQVIGNFAWKSRSWNCDSYSIIEPCCRSSNIRDRRLYSKSRGLVRSRKFCRKRCLILWTPSVAHSVAKMVRYQFWTDFLRKFEIRTTNSNESACMRCCLFE